MLYGLSTYLCADCFFLTIIHQFTMFGLERFSIYSGFGLDRFLIYSGFGLDRFSIYSGFGLDRFLIYSGFGLDRFSIYSGFGLDRFSIYSGFGLDRFSIYSGFGLDRFHCIRCLFLFVAFVLLVAVKLVNWPCLRRLSYSQIQVMIMSACNVTYDIEGWSIPYVCLIYRYSKVKDPCRIRFWWVPTKIRTSAFFCKNCEWKTQVMSPELA